LVRDMRRDPLLRAPPVKAGGIIASPGQCEYYDRRRAYLADTMRRSRKRQKEKK
jgi:hypothetical protein